MKKKILIFLFFLFLINNVSFAETSVVKDGFKSVFRPVKSMEDTMNAVLQSWMDYDLNQVIEHLGYPTRSNIIAGRQLYYWEKQGGVTSSYNPYAGMAGTINTRESFCNIVLEVNAENIVVRGEWKGTTSVCPSTHKTAKKWINPQNDLLLIKKQNKEIEKKKKKNKI